MRPQRESAVTTRAVQVERVPDGTPFELPSGAQVQITQALGSAFTLAVGGQLVRLKGSDADAIGKPLPVAVVVPENVGRDDVRDLVWQTLKTCYDPEIPLDIVELGLVYVCDVLPIDEERFRVSIKMTLTAPGCGMGQTIVDDVYAKLLALPRVAEVDVELVFDPPWDRFRLSEAAKLTLGL